MRRDGRPLERVRGSTGHTLVELLVMVVVLAILSSIAGVAAGVSGTQHLDMAEVQLRDALGWAQSQARSNRSPVAVVFDPDHDRFALVDADGVMLPDPLTRDAYLVSFHRPNQPRLVDLVAVQFGAAGKAAIFDAQGVPMTGGTVTLTARGTTRVLSIDPATGAITSS